MGVEVQQSINQNESIFYKSINQRRTDFKPPTSEPVERRMVHDHRKEWDTARLSCHFNTLLNDNAKKLEDWKIFECDDDEPPNPPNYDNVEDAVPGR